MREVYLYKIPEFVAAQRFYVPKGPESDLSAVVNPCGEVRGIKALRVVDASILPDIPSLPTSVTTIMVAERIAARLSR